MKRSPSSSSEHSANASWPARWSYEWLRPWSPFHSFVLLRAQATAFRAAARDLSQIAESRVNPRCVTCGDRLGVRSCRPSSMTLATSPNIVRPTAKPYSIEARRSLETLPQAPPPARRGPTRRCTRVVRGHRSRPPRSRWPRLQARSSVRASTNRAKYPAA